jgi:hypothetical protein
MQRLRLSEGEDRRSQKLGWSNTELAVQLDAPRATFKRRIRSVSERIGPYMYVTYNP